MTARKRVLIVVGSYCPTMTPDMHRARILCYELPAHGWDVEILTPDISFQRRATVNAQDAIFFDAKTPVHSAAAWLPWAFRLAQMNGIGFRSLWPMFRLGHQLLKTKRFDLVYFSTTQFPLFILGPLWHALDRVPYVLDFQDPWYSSKKQYVATSRRWKWIVSRWLARPLQRFAVGRAGAIVAVSPRYLEELRTTYRGQAFPWMAPDRQAVVPFAGANVDIETARRTSGDPLPAAQDAACDATQPSAKLPIVYVGAGGITRLKAWEALCRAAILVRNHNPSLIERFQFRLYGTTGDPAAADAGLLEQTGKALGLEGFVTEHPAQVSYFRSLELAHRAAGLVVLGVDDASYTPSKLFNYLLFEQPVLAVCHAQSPAAAFLRSHPTLAYLICFDSEQPCAAESGAEVLEQYLQAVAAGRRQARAADLADYLAPAMAWAHAALFDRCAKPGEPSNSSQGIAAQ